jgi:threonine dehydrogenase-like Zn-dependent dehydrogenase
MRPKIVLELFAGRGLLKKLLDPLLPPGVEYIATDSAAREHSAIGTKVQKMTYSQALGKYLEQTSVLIIAFGIIQALERIFKYIGKNGKVLILWMYNHQYRIIKNMATNHGVKMRTLSKDTLCYLDYIDKDYKGDKLVATFTPPNSIVVVCYKS